MYMYVWRLCYCGTGIMSVPYHKAAKRFKGDASKC